MDKKITFLVVKEHTLCYVYPHQPLLGWILRASVLRGASLRSMDGCIALPLDGDWVFSDACPKPLPLDGSHEVKLDPSSVRRATLADFEAFGISAKGYLNDPARYELPVAA